MNGRALPGAEPQRHGGAGGEAPRPAVDIAHDLRTPLNAIRTWAHLLEAQLAASGDPLVRRALEGIHAGIDQQARLIADLLEASPVPPPFGQDTPGARSDTPRPQNGRSGTPGGKRAGKGPR